MRVASLDHLVLTVASIPAAVEFYERLGMRAETFGDGRHPLRFGSPKINLHEAGAQFAPDAEPAVPGSGDLCFLLDGPLDEAARVLREAGVAIELGPIAREGAAGALESLYVRDPDGNLVELSRP